MQSHINYQFLFCTRSTGTGEDIGIVVGEDTGTCKPSFLAEAEDEEVEEKGTRPRSELEEEG